MQSNRDRIGPERLRAAAGGTGEEAIRVVARLRREGAETYLAGGCVRDLLLGREPVDFDVATSARPETVERLFPKTVPVGVAFGTIAVVGERGTYQVTTFRTDGRYLDARRPESVTFGDARGDAERRDFTVNGLFLDPETGEVVDFVGGTADLRARTVRAIGDPAVRFAEDALRMLRAPRFAAALGFEIEAATAAAVRALAPTIRKISAERVRDEVVKILTGPDPSRGIRLLDNLALLAQILPEIAAMKGVAQPPQFHPEGDVLTHTLLLLDRLERRTPILALAGLLHDVGKPPTFSIAERIRFDGHTKVGAAMAEEILRRLRFSNREIEAIVTLVREHLRLPDVPRMREGRRRRFLRRPDLEDHLALHRADCLASHGDLSAYEACREALARLREEDLRPPPLLRGNDLLALGHAPGPIFREILRAVEDEQLEGRLHTREEALAWVRKRYPLGAQEKGPPRR